MSPPNKPQPTTSPASATPKKRNDPKKRPVPEVSKRPPRAADEERPAAHGGGAKRPAPRARPQGEERAPPRAGAPKGQRPAPKRPPLARPPHAKAPRDDDGDARRGAQRPSRPPQGERGPPRRTGTAAEGPIFVGGERNVHGTRIARRVTCRRCGTTDHVPYVPRNPGTALCRNCAALELKAYEVGVKVRAPTRTVACNLCGTPFALPLSVEDDGDPLCPSCLRGFTSWQGSVDVPFAERKNVEVEERLSGALLRRKKAPVVD